MLYDVAVPPNTTADLLLPVSPESVRESGRAVSTRAGGTTSLPLEPGAHHFAFPRASLDAK
jgi:hypothetical protein